MYSAYIKYSVFSLTTYYRLFVPPLTPKFLCWNLIPHMVLFGAEALGGEDVFCVRLAPLQERPQRAPSALLPARTRETPLSADQGSGSSPDSESASALILDLPGSRSMRNTFYLVKPHGLWCLCHSSPRGLGHH